MLKHLVFYSTLFTFFCSPASSKEQNAYFCTAKLGTINDCYYKSGFFKKRCQSFPLTGSTEMRSPVNFAKDRETAQRNICEKLFTKIKQDFGEKRTWPYTCIESNFLAPPSRYPGTCEETLDLQQTHTRPYCGCGATNYAYDIVSLQNLSLEKFVGVTKGGSAYSNARGVGNEEHIKIVRSEEGPLKDRDTVHLQASNGLYLAVDGSGKLSAQDSITSKATAFQVYGIKVWSKLGEIHSSDQISLKSVKNNRFLVAVQGGQSLQATLLVPSAFGLFTVRFLNKEKPDENPKPQLKYELFDTKGKPIDRTPANYTMTVGEKVKVRWTANYVSNCQYKVESPTGNTEAEGTRGEKLITFSKKGLYKLNIGCRTNMDTIEVSKSFEVRDKAEAWVKWKSGESDWKELTQESEKIQLNEDDTIDIEWNSIDARYCDIEMRDRSYNAPLDEYKKKGSFSHQLKKDQYILSFKCVGENWTLNRELTIQVNLKPVNMSLLIDVGNGLKAVKGGETLKSQVGHTIKFKWVSDNGEHCYFNVVERPYEKVFRYHTSFEAKGETTMLARAGKRYPVEFECGRTLRSKHTEMKVTIQTVGEAPKAPEKKDEYKMPELEMSKMGTMAP